MSISAIIHLVSSYLYPIVRSISAKIQWMLPEVCWTTVDVDCKISNFYLQMIYMPLTVWGPSLALDQGNQFSHSVKTCWFNSVAFFYLTVAGVNRYISSAVIFIVCVAYSSIVSKKSKNVWSLNVLKRLEYRKCLEICCSSREASRRYCGPMFCKRL